MKSSMQPTSHSRAMRPQLHQASETAYDLCRKSELSDAFCYRTVEGDDSERPRMTGSDSLWVPTRGFLPK